jgi:hypothetical protein
LLPHLRWTVTQNPTSESVLVVSGASGAAKESREEGYGRGEGGRGGEVEEICISSGEEDEECASRASQLPAASQGAECERAITDDELDEVVFKVGSTFVLLYSAILDILKLQL